jgi:hypothetical protein
MVIDRAFLLSAQSEHVGTATLRAIGTTMARSMKDGNPRLPRVVLSDVVPWELKREMCMEVVCVPRCGCVCVSVCTNMSVRVRHVWVIARLCAPVAAVDSWHRLARTQRLKCKLISRESR